MGQTHLSRGYLAKRGKEEGCRIKPPIAFSLVYNFLVGFTTRVLRVGSQPAF